MKKNLSNSVGRLLTVLIILTGIGLTSSSAWAQNEQVTININAIRELDTPFAVEGFRVTDPNIAMAEKQGAQKLRVMGLNSGNTDLQVTGEGGQSIIYSIRVIGTSETLARSVQQALDDVPEIDVTVNGDKIMLKGELSSLSHWRLKEQVVLAFGESTILDLTQLQLPPELILLVRSSLEKAGYDVVGKDETVGSKAPGKLRVEGSGRTIFVTGSVYSAMDIAKIKAALEAYTWLVVKSDEAQEVSETSYTAVMNVGTLSTMLEVDVAFLGLSDEEQTKVGVNLFEAGLLSIEAVGAAAGEAVNMYSKERTKNTVDGIEEESEIKSDVRSRKYNNGGTYAVASSLAGTLQLYIGRSPERLIHKGHLTFRNGAEEFKSFHSGGTLKVRVTSDNAAEIEDIDYGLMLKVRGGLTSEDDTALDVHVELSTPEMISGTEDYDLKKDTIETSLNCRLGHTMILGGANRLLDGLTESGTPFLRSIPMLRFLFSEKSSGKTEKRLLILLSPQLVGAPRPAPPLSEETIKLIEDVQVDPGDREREGKRKFFFF